MTYGIIDTMKPGPKPQDPMQRFLKKVSGMDNPDGCWEWTGYRQNSGRGQGMFYIGSPNNKCAYMSAHRWYYQQTTKDALTDLDLHRTCENQGCVNPQHIEEREHPDTEEGRFLLKVDFNGSNGCWEWTGRVMTEEFPYGHFAILRDGRWAPIGTHRWSWNQYVEPLQQEDYIDHLCFNFRCVNPDHLRVVTNKQNMEHRRSPGRNNTSGYLGVCFTSSRGKWRAAVGHDGKQYHFGYFNTPEEANQAAIEGRKSLFTHNNRDYEDWGF